MDKDPRMQWERKTNIFCRGESFVVGVIVCVNGEILRMAHEHALCHYVI